MNNQDNFIDLGSDPTDELDPFASNEPEDDFPDITDEQAKVEPEDIDSDKSEKIESETEVKANTAKPKTDTAEKEAENEQGYADKPPIFEYAGAAENIDDTAKTFDELRIEKSSDFPELDDGKRVSWTVEYGKITKTVADPKGMSISKMKSDIETSKEFLDSLKKPKADKHPICKLKPRVTAQSKGTVESYKGVFTNIKEAEAAGKIISIVPAKNGKIFEIRDTEMGKFITPIESCDMLSDIRAGFNSALPLLPMDLMMRIVAFFRYYMNDGIDKEVLLNIYWDKENREFTVDAPEQIVSKASVNSKISEKYDNDRYIHYMDIHSHNSMKAFFSAIDDRDEKATRLYTVIGNLHEYFPDVKTRISNGGKFCEIDPAEVFELVARPFPSEWKDNVHFRDFHENYTSEECGRYKLKDEVDYI